MSRGVNMAASPYIYSQSLGQAVCCSYPENHRCQVLKILKKTVENYKSWPNLLDWWNSTGEYPKLTAHFAAVVSYHRGLTNVSDSTSLTVPASIACSTSRTSWSAIYIQFTGVAETITSQEVNSQLINRIVGISYNFCCMEQSIYQKPTFFCKLQTFLFLNQSTHILINSIYDFKLHIWCRKNLLPQTIF